VIIRLVEDRATAVSPVGTDGGVRSPVADGLAEGLAVGDSEADGEAEGDGLGSVPGVTRPVIVHESIHS
jgi:hypothetical protein